MPSARTVRLSPGLTTPSVVAVAGVPGSPGSPFAPRGRPNASVVSPAASRVAVTVASMPASRVRAVTPAIRSPRGMSRMRLLSPAPSVDMLAAACWEGLTVFAPTPMILLPRGTPTISV